MRLRNPESREMEEMCKWEGSPSEWTLGRQPGNPFIKGNTNPKTPDGRGAAGSEYPKMLYRAQRIPGSGKLATMMSDPPTWQYKRDEEWMAACEQARAFTRGCQREVKNEDQERKLLGQGWSLTQPDALALAQKEQDALGQERAERDHRDRNMSAKAQAEKDAFDAASFGHHPEVKEQPKRRKPGPKPKVKAEAEPVPA